MSKGLASYPENERARVVERRLKQKSGGNGYLAAVDYQARKPKARQGATNEAN